MSGRAATVQVFSARLGYECAVSQLELLGAPLRMWSHHLGARSWCPQVSASQWVAFVRPAGVQEVLSKLFLNNEIHSEP